jgi:outer membrane immunogenic protein
MRGVCSIALGAVMGIAASTCLAPGASAQEGPYGNLPDPATIVPVALSPVPAPPATTGLFAPPPTTPSPRARKARATGTKFIGRPILRAHKARNQKQVDARLSQSGAANDRGPDPAAPADAHRAYTALSSGAVAADPATAKAPPVVVPPPPIFTWTGLYIGGQVGFEWGVSSTNIEATPGGPVVAGLPNYSPVGGGAGAHIGYNYQIGMFVATLEGEVNGMQYSGSNHINGFSYSTHEDVEASVRGRVGLAFDRALFYVAVGGAFVGLTNTYAGVGYDSLSRTQVGWTVGGGVEYAFADNWSLRGEYLFSDYGRYEDVLADNGGYASRDETDNKVEIGFSYKFGLDNPAPVVTKY